MVEPLYVRIVGCLGSQSFSLAGNYSVLDRTIAFAFGETISQDGEDHDRTRLVTVVHRRCRPARHEMADRPREA